MKNWCEQWPNSEKLDLTVFSRKERGSDPEEQATSGRKEKRY
jgi:hypothetical protein